ncbi:MAG: hypothetical protein EAZ63_03625 [Runella slithyformis]|nr:MAG: hypothetical protein EAZ63_03625 [Runella slithyformis]
MKLRWKELRKPPSKAIDSFRQRIAVCVDEYNMGERPDLTPNQIGELMANEAKKVSRKLWISSAGLNSEKVKEAHIWLMYGTDNGGKNLGTLVIEKEVGDGV